MDFFQKLLAPQKPIDMSGDFRPGWKEVFSGAGYFNFLNMLLSYLRGQGLDFTLKKESLVLQKTGAQIELADLAQACSRQDPGSWRRTIAAYFESRPDLLAEALGVRSLHSFAQAASLLAVRLLPAGTLAALGAKNLVYRSDLAETVTLLVVDDLKPVSPADVARWAKPEAELFAAALQNVAAKVAVETAPILLDEGSQGLAIRGSHPLSAAHALLLKDHPAVLGPAGCLFCVPHRGLVACCPVGGTEALQTIPALIRFAFAEFQGGAGAISPYLYWFDGQQSHFLPYDLQEKKISLSPGLEELVKKVGYPSK
jgi:hypothetical protein